MPRFVTYELGVRVDGAANLTVVGKEGETGVCLAPHTAGDSLPFSALLDFCPDGRVWWPLFADFSLVHSLPTIWSLCFPRHTTMRFILGLILSAHCPVPYFASLISLYAFGVMFSHSPKYCLVCYACFAIELTCCLLSLFYRLGYSCMTWLAVPVPAPLPVCSTAHWHFKRSYDVLSRLLLMMPMVCSPLKL